MSLCLYLCRRPFATDVNLPNRLTIADASLRLPIFHSIATNAAGTARLQRRLTQSQRTEPQHSQQVAVVVATTTSHEAERGRVSVLVPSTIGALLSLASLQRECRERDGSVSGSEREWVQYTCCSIDLLLLILLLFWWLVFFTTITTTALTYRIHNFYCYSTICYVNNLWGQIPKLNLIDLSLR